ncbi:MAG: biotin/lipoyl-binding protein [Chloroflexi bacterium]|nr:biotin/lipoyl-binding protein [Chloroflexota bacterium]
MTVEAGDFRLRLRSGRTREAASGAPATVALASDADPATPAAPTELTIYAPMIGTFFAGPSPTEPPFVTEGDHIEPGQTVAIIEAMKIMNEIQSDQAGVLVEVLARNGQGVEFGQALFRLQPPP